MFRYIGGKSKQAKWISELFPEKIDTYVEVFGGAFWVYIKSDIQAKKAIYNDFNPVICNLWRCLKQYNKFIPMLERMEPQDKELFKHCVDKVNKFVDSGKEIKKIDFDLAKHYVYWISHSFSGFSKGMSSVNTHLPVINRLKDTRIRTKLDKIEVYNKSFDEIIPMFDNENTLFYIDPPYYDKENYYKFHNFTMEHHRKLSEVIKKMKGKAVISYYRYPEMSEFYPEEDYWYEEREFKKSSTLVKKGEKRTTGTEILIFNYDHNKDKNDTLDLFFDMGR